MDNELYRDRLVWFTIVWALVSPIELIISEDRWIWACLSLAGGALLAGAWRHYYRNPETEPASEESP